MLTDYENKVLTPNVGKTDECPSCAGNNWKKVTYGPHRSRRCLVCKRCGYVKGGSK